MILFDQYDTTAIFHRHYFVFILPDSPSFLLPTSVLTFR